MKYLMTLHAKLRWLERIEGYDSDAVRELIAETKGIEPSAVHDAAIVELILEKTGRTSEELEAQIITPGRKAAIDAGAKSIRIGDDCYLAIEGGLVITVFRSGGRAKRGAHKMILDRKRQKKKRKERRRATRGR